MGWDVSYHPIAAEEINSIYFRGLEQPATVQALMERFEVDPFYQPELEKRFAEARQLEAEVPFEKGHAFYLAMVAGHLRRYHYIRGGALSFAADEPVISRYFADWRLLVPEPMQDAAAGNHLHENYGGGVFIDLPQLQRLRADYAQDAQLRSRLDELFSHGRLEVFWKALDEAVAQGCGLLEATEVIQPNPMDLNASRSISNLFNCSPDGALLYAEAAQEQLAAAMQQSAPSAPSPPPKKGLLGRLFGK